MAEWSKLLLRTAGLRLFVLPISAGLALVAAAIALQTAGVAAFGLITMVAHLKLALPFADLGMGAAVTSAVARASQSAQARDYAEALIRRTAGLLGVVGVIGAAGAITAGAAGVWSSIFRLPTELAGDFDVVATVVLIIFFLGLPFGLAERILIGQSRAPLIVVLGIIPGAINVAVAGTVATLGLPPMWLAAGLPIGAAVFLTSCVIAARRGGALTHNARPVQVSLRSILIAGLPVVLTTAGVVLAEQHGRALLGILATPSVLSEYALGIYLYMPVYSVLYMGATVLWPRFAQNPDLHTWRMANRALLMLGCGAALGYLIFARPLSSLVSAGELVLSWPVVAAFCLAFIAQSGHLVQANLLTDPWGFRRQAFMALTLLILVVPLTSAGVAVGFGAAAPALALATAVVMAQVIPGRIFARRSLHRTAALPADTVPVPETRSYALHTTHTEESTTVGEER